MQRIILATILAALAVPALADSTAAAKISTLGFGVDVAFPMTDSIDGRVGLNGYNYGFNRTATTNGVATNYTGSLNLTSVEMLADWHPWESGFRVTAGLVYNGNKLSMTGVPTGGTINIGGVNYATGGGTVNASVDFKKLVPYVGFGWGSAPKDSGLSFAADLGILFQGTPNSNVTTNIAGVAAADIAQANADLKNSLKNFRYYPVASVGLGYTF
ncbi:MAG: hypothetical protein HY849_05380 [Nitrosomonadales bacterium]|nr:hypothetical protein [Nitrosomonadales bacterium]